MTSLMAHSLEAGNLQVRNDILAQGQLQVSGGVNVGAGGIFSDGDVGISGTVAIYNDIVPSTSPANLVQLYAEDVAASSELKVRDEAGNISTLSPHNFSLIGEPSEPLAWSFYSENQYGKINVDMLKTVRLVEELSGEKLVYIQSKSKHEFDNISMEPYVNDTNRINELKEENKNIKKELEGLKVLVKQLISERSSE